MRRVRRQRGKDPEKAVRTLKSYLLQEVEGYAREAKLEWCAHGGHVAMNMQHDGVVIALRDGLMAAAAAARHANTLS